MDENEVNNYINQLQQQNDYNQQRLLEQNKMQSSLFQSEESVNLIQSQLEVDALLERIDHLLRGHELKFDGQGNLSWQKPKNQENQIFTEYGVQEILRFVSMYINKNTLLSYYDQETINWKVYDIGYDLTDFIFLKYDKMFRYETEDELKDKIKIYILTVRELVDAIHSCYQRALFGEERASLRKAMYVTQNANPNSPLMGMQNPYNNTNVNGGFNLFNPITWLKKR
jgi:hypothetical protein